MQSKARPVRALLFASVPITDNFDQSSRAGYPSMWAVTSYYNPVRYRRRLTNYRRFRANLGLPLVTVELSFNGQFELTDHDADILIQISGGAVLWQKERLLNVAISSVPSNVKNIAWIDCDVIFARSNWMDEATRRLEEFNVIQLFSEVTELSSENYRTPQDCFNSLTAVPSIASAYHANNPIPVDRPGYKIGFAWAATRTILEDHCLYDAMIVGGGDRSLVAAIYGQFDEVIKLQHLSAARQAHYLKWARPYHNSVAHRVGSISGTICHLWHGDMENRNYFDRHASLARLDFEPDYDLVVGVNGAWHWARTRTELQEFLTKYFIDRAEDG